MIGAICGDIIGSVHEFTRTKTSDFPLFTEESRFTDDSVLTIAVADKLLHPGDPMLGSTNSAYVRRYHEYFHAYPNAGYGVRFINWALVRLYSAYNSWGNGSAMRVSPVGWAFESIEETVAEARRSAEATHNHPEGIRGAEATAAAIYLARSGAPKEAIRMHVESSYGYDLGRRLDDIRMTYEFDESCQGTVPEALVAFLESEDYEGAVRNAISLGGDADTLACIAGGVAEAFYGGVPDHIRTPALALLDSRLRSVVDAFQARFM